MSKFALLNLCLNLMKTTGETFLTGVTLFVNGAIISGDLIHPRAYFKGVAELLEAQPDDPNSTKGANFLGKTMGEVIEKIIKTPIQTQEKDGNKAEDVIYLKNIALWNPPGSMIIEGTFIALDIDSIDGFIWGKSSLTPARDDE